MLIFHLFIYFLSFFLFLIVSSYVIIVQGIHSVIQNEPLVTLILFDILRSQTNKPLMHCPKPCMSTGSCQWCKRPLTVTTNLKNWQFFQNILLDHSMKRASIIMSLNCSYPHRWVQSAVVICCCVAGQPGCCGGAVGAGVCVR